MTIPAIPIEISEPLNVAFDANTKALTLSCYQMLSDGQGLQMALHLTPQATMQLLRAVEHLQKEFGISSEQLSTPHSVQ